MPDPRPEAEERQLCGGDIAGRGIGVALEETNPAAEQVEAVEPVADNVEVDAAVGRAEPVEDPQPAHLPRERVVVVGLEECRQEHGRAALSDAAHGEVAR